MGQKISQLTALSTTYADTDLLEVSVDTGGGTFVTRKMTFLQLRTAFTKLQANLDVNSFQITSASNGNIIIRPNGSGAVLVGGNSSQATELRFMEDSDNGTNYVALKVADALAASTTYTLPTADGTTGQVLSTNGTGTLSWATAAGGLTNFTEAANSSAPNGTVPVNSLTATGAATNIDAAIVPKGTGAFTLAIPDNTTTGGNKRGTNAIDLQTSRSNAANVASGQSSIVIGQDNRGSNLGSIAIGLANLSLGDYGASAIGYANTSSGQASIAIGNNNQSSNTQSVALGRGNVCSGYVGTAIGQSNVANNTLSVGIGNQHTSSGQYSVCIGGTLGIASGSYSSVIGGYANTASGTTSIAGGDGCVASATNAVALGGSNVADAASSVALGLQSSTFGIIGRNVFASGQEGTRGDAQTSKFVLRERTTGNTATTLTTDSGAAGTTNQVILSNQSAYRFKGSIVGKQSGSTNAAVWDIDGFIVRGANAAATTLNVSNVNLVQNTPAWGTPTLAADTTNGGLQVQVTGAAATNIQWTAVIETTEVIYA